MTTFHLIYKTFSAITVGRLKDVLLHRRNDVEIGDRIRFCCDATQVAASAIVTKVHYPQTKHDAMVLSIKDVETIDYDICD